ncbi:MAG: arginine--tRNA ligase, partial [Oscillospiraceae bacterium]|nr:arginine--tRNA ligase [Oscillospiraceae bacterium]
MFDQFTQAKMSARAIIEDALALCISKGSLLGEAAVTYTIEVPKDSDKGDLACNVALVGAKQFREAPAKISEILTEAIGEFPEDSIFQKIEIAGPGFINFFFSSNYYENALSGIITAGSDYGKTAGKGAKYMVEYVSANPTGPMHLGNARGGALGDCLAGILEMAGYDIFREFYVNDAGGQIEKFAVSLESRYLQIYDSSIEFPEGGYLGQDIIDRAEEFAEIHGSTYIGSPSNERKEALVNYALPVNIENMKNDLMRYRIEYQLWFYESTLHINNTIEKVMDILKNRDLIYTMDGAVWYKATEYGGEKDEVMVRSNGYYTYFAVDVAYHYNKFVERGF